MENFTERKTPAGLYSPRFEHDNCGIGAVVDIKGRKSHKTIDDALQIVEHLEHRAGKDAEGKTGDGVGILTQISDKFFQKAAAEQGLTLGAEREYGIGMFFFPQDELKRNQAKKLFEIVCKKEGLPFLGWREVPTCPEVLGHIPELEPRPPQPLHPAQRRDQHDPRQRGHDACPRGNHRFQLFKGRYDEGSSHRQPGRLRLCPAG